MNTEQRKHNNQIAFPLFVSKEKWGCEKRLGHGPLNFGVLIAGVFLLFYVYKPKGLVRYFYNELTNQIISKFPPPKNRWNNAVALFCVYVRMTGGGYSIYLMLRRREVRCECECGWFLTKYFALICFLFNIGHHIIQIRITQQFAHIAPVFFNFLLLMLHM